MEEKKNSVSTEVAVQYDKNGHPIDVLLEEEIQLVQKKPPVIRKPKPEVKQPVKSRDRGFSHDFGR